MISVLIASFGHDVEALCQAVFAQATAAGIPFEIIVSDDRPQGNPHPPSHARYMAQPVNLGRAENRNFLARQAQYPYLLFLDADAEIPEGFVQGYLNHLRPDTVLVGGTGYSPKAPGLHQQLRWNYGRQREEIPASRRNQRPYRSFSTFNFLIPASIFEQHPLVHTGPYGHEDTLLGLALQAQKISLIHLNNPAIHLGLDDNGIFLQKTRTALDAHLKLMQEDTFLHSGLENLFRYFNQPALRWAARWIIQGQEKRLKKLTAGHGTLRDFDRYRLAYLLERAAAYSWPKRR
jgi:glycosyltransferase involved in cell wall biosynthesis